MKKKLVIVVALAAVLATGPAFADGFGIGVHGGFGGPGGGGGLNLAFSNLFLYIDAVAASGSSFHVAGAVDFISLLHNEFVDTLSFYIRVGVGAALWGYDHLGDSGLGVAAGVRLPIGLSWMPLDFLELFVQGVPQVGVRIAGREGSDSGFGLWSNFWGANLGIRFWF